MEVELEAIEAFGFFMWDSRNFRALRQRWLGPLEGNLNMALSYTIHNYTNGIKPQQSAFFNSVFGFWPETEITEPKQRTIGY